VTPSRRSTRPVLSMAHVLNPPNTDLYTIDVSYQALQDKSERDFLNQLPPTFVLPNASVDRLRAAAATIILEWAELAVADRGLANE
jgi:NTE family protein